MLNGKLNNITGYKAIFMIAQIQNYRGYNVELHCLKKKKQFCVESLFDSRVIIVSIRCEIPFHAASYTLLYHA